MTVKDGRKTYLYIGTLGFIRVKITGNMHGTHNWEGLSCTVLNE